MSKRGTGGQHWDEEEKARSTTSSGSSSVPSIEMARGGGDASWRSLTGSDRLGEHLHSRPAKHLSEGGRSQEADEESPETEAQRLLLELQMTNVDDSSLPYELDREVDVQVYNALLDMDHPYKLDLKNNKLRILECPGPEHESASEHCHMYFSNIFGNTLRSYGSRRWASNNNDKDGMEGDESWAKRPPNAHGAGPFTDDELVFVVEISWSESTDHMKEKAQRWITETTCNEVLGISIYPWPRDGYVGVWRRSSPTNPVQQRIIRYEDYAPARVIVHISLTSIFGGQDQVPQHLRDRFPGPEHFIPTDLYPILEAARDTPGERRNMAIVQSFKREGHQGLIRVAGRQPMLRPSGPNIPLQPSTSGQQATQQPAAEAADIPIPYHNNAEYSQIVNKKMPPWAQPLAERRLSNKLYELVRKASRQDGRLQVTTPRVTEELNRGQKGIVLIAGDNSGKSKYRKLATLCREKGQPYIYMPSRQSLQEACEWTNVSALMVKVEEEEYEEIISEIEAMHTASRAMSAVRGASLPNRSGNRKEDKFTFGGKVAIQSISDHILESVCKHREGETCQGLALPQLPEMLFHHNLISLSLSGSSPRKSIIEFNTFDALKLVEVGSAPELVVGPSEAWLSSRKETLTSAGKPFDWTYTSNYKGTVGSDLLVEPTNEQIDYDRLRRQDPILFYSSLILYEDELGDNGCAQMAVRIRVMPGYFFLLCRFYLRVDHVMVRTCETRIYGTAGKDYLIREWSKREASFAQLINSQEDILNPDAISPSLPLVESETSKIHYPQ